MAHPAVNALSNHASCVLMVQRVRPHINGVSWMLFKSGILMHAGSLQLLLLLMLLLRRTFEACRSSDVKQLQTSLRGTWPVQRQQNGQYAHKPCSSCIVQHLLRESLQQNVRLVTHLARQARRRTRCSRTPLRQKPAIYTSGGCASPRGNAVTLDPTRDLVSFVVCEARALRQR